MDKAIQKRRTIAGVSPSGCNNVGNPVVNALRFSYTFAISDFPRRYPEELTLG